MILSMMNLVLPLTDPVLKFLVILLIILIIPLLSDKFKIPHILGMILAGVVIGPHGLNLLERDSSIIMSGTAGLLYIMFLAGLEIDLADFKKNSKKSIIFGMYTFIIPMILGTFAGVYILGFSISTSVLLASMFASHTLITYPIISKFGVTKNRAVNITVGGTMITDTLALLVLAVIVGMTTGEVNSEFWIRLSLSILIFGLIVILIFPLIGLWFFKRFENNVSQYIFVLVMVFLSAVLAEIAGIEAMIGAFLAGLALNRLIPQTSPLMNRIDFVGNAIFIPFFLIGVGMLIDYRAFGSIDTLIVAAVMTVIAIAGKYLAAVLTQKTLRLTKDEGMLIFGLSNAQAAATLAAVLVGYNIIIGQTETGEPIRLLNDSVLNGTVIMILVTCTVASFVTQRRAQNIALLEHTDEDVADSSEKILIPFSNPSNIEELVSLSTILKSKSNRHGLYGLNIINSDNTDADTEHKARKLLDKAKVAAAAVDIQMKTFLRYDSDVVQGVTNIIKENNITDLILGLHKGGNVTDSFLGKLTDGILKKANVTTCIYRPFQPISTIKRHMVIIPENAEYESGFSFWIAKIWNIALNTGSRIVFYSSEHTLKMLKDISAKHPIEAEYKLFADWDDFLILSRDFRSDDNLIIVLSRQNLLSYKAAMNNIPGYLNKYFNENNYMLIYPVQSLFNNGEKVELNNPSLIEAVGKIDIIGKTIAGIFKKR
jgi:Kef-type K+ transport system membrane component KefB